MIIPGNFSRVGKKTAATNDGIRLQLGRDVDPSFDFDKVSKSAVWRKHVPFEVPKKPATASIGTWSFKAQPRKENISPFIGDLSYNTKFNVTHPRSHSAHINKQHHTSIKNVLKSVDLIYDIPDPHVVPVSLFGQYLPRSPLLSRKGHQSELGEPLKSSLSKRGSPDLAKSLSRKKIEQDTYFDPGRYSQEGMKSEKGLPPWTVRPAPKVDKKMPLLSQMTEITFAEPQKKTNRPKQSLVKASTRKAEEWTKEQLILQFRTMGAFALRERKRKAELEDKGIEWRTAENFQAARNESLEAFLPSCDKCSEVLVCKSCTRFDCDDCGYILQCIRCMRRREKVEELQNAGRGSRRPTLPINTAVQYSILDIRRLTGDMLFDDPVAQMEYEHLEERQRLEKEIARLSDQLNDMLGKSDTYFEKFHAARADWKVEQHARVQLELQLANAKAEIRNMADAITEARLESLRLRNIFLDSVEESTTKLDQMLERWADQDSRLLLTFLFRGWRVGRLKSKYERQIEQLTENLATTNNALNQAKDLILRMNQRIDTQDARIVQQRAKLIAMGKEKIARVMGSWRPQGRALQAWGAAAVIAKAEREKDLAINAAGEAFQLLDTTERQKREISILSKDLERSEAEAAKGRLYLEELGKTNRVVRKLKEQVAHLEEERQKDQVRFEEEKSNLKREIQKIHHSILTDTHATVLHEAIERLKAELDHEKNRKSHAFMSTASSTMCGSCGRATLYRSFVDKSSHEHSEDTVISSGFLPRIPR